VNEQNSVRDLSTRQGSRVVETKLRQKPSKKAKSSSGELNNWKKAEGSTAQVRSLAQDIARSKTVANHLIIIVPGSQDWGGGQSTKTKGTFSFVDFSQPHQPDSIGTEVCQGRLNQTGNRKTNNCRIHPVPVFYNNLSR